MAEVNLRQRYEVPADAMWSHIGDFDAIDRWFPVIVQSELINDGRTRDLRTDVGQKVVETLLERNERSYRYSVDEMPLPIGDYTSTISVLEATGGACAVTWVSHFEPVGVSQEEAVALITGYLQSGLDSLDEWARVQAAAPSTHTTA